MSIKNFLTPKEMALELWGSTSPGNLKKAYRWLRNGHLDRIGELNGCPVIMDGNRYNIPYALIRAIRGELISGYQRNEPMI